MHVDAIPMGFDANLVRGVSHVSFQRFGLIVGGQAQFFRPDEYLRRELGDSSTVSLDLADAIGSSGRGAKIHIHNGYGFISVGGTQLVVNLSAKTHERFSENHGEYARTWFAHRAAELADTDVVLSNVRDGFMAGASGSLLVRGPADHVVSKAFHQAFDLAPHLQGETINDLAVSQNHQATLVTTQHQLLLVTAENSVRTLYSSRFAGLHSAWFSEDGRMVFAADLGTANWRRLPL